MTKIEQSIEVNVPVRTAYDQLTRFEEYPRFMENVEEVRQLDDKHLHWHTRTSNLDMEWDAEITQQVPDRCIAWRNTSGPRYEGRIELQQTAEDRTRLKVTMECEPKQQMLAQHGNAETMIAQRTEHDLLRFKKFVERLAGEQAESGKQHGRLTDADVDASSGTELQVKRTQETQARPAQDTAAMPEFFRFWSEPMALMRRMSEDMDRFAATFFGMQMNGMLKPRSAGTGWMPAVETLERDDRFVVNAEVPGVRREDLSVDINAERLTIEGERRQEAPAQGRHEYRRSERSYGRFCRVIALPAGADTDAASASLHDGMLEVTVPVARQQQERRKLDIRG
jgi:HSP20 family molecular chaperone IbpA